MTSLCQSAARAAPSTTRGGVPLGTPIRLPPAPPPPKPNVLQRIQNWWQGWFGTRQEVQGENTTQAGAQVESPAYHEAQVEQLRYDREAIIQDARNLIDDDPRAAQSNMEIGRDVFGAGLRVTARAVDGTPDAVVAKAQDVLDALFRDCDINGQGPGLISGLLEDGELYLQPIIRDTRIARMQPYPTLTMEPIMSTAGQFGDVMQAFRQIDILTREEVARFPLWQVNWIRYDLRLTRGTANGRSHYMPVRGLGRSIGRAENDLVVRRRMRAPLTRHHQVGAPGSNDQTAVKAYMTLNGYDKPDAAKKVLTDIFSTGDVTVTNLEGDANLGEIDDVKHLDNVYWVKLGKPRGLMGYGEDINRDVLEQQQDEYNEFLQGLRNLIWNGDGGVYSGIKALCDFALSLAGINPELVTYQPTWPRKLTNAQIKQIEAIDKARVSQFISHRTALELIGGMLGLESSEAELALIQQEREDRMKANNADDRAFAAGQTGSANRPQLDPGDTGDGEGVSMRMRKTRGAQPNNTMMQ